MTEKIIEVQAADRNRLLTIANLQQTDSDQNIIVWFFETPQIFEFNLGTQLSQQYYSLLKEAKAKQIPVNVHSTTILEKNIIDRVIPATESQIELYKKEKAKN